ncbi:serine-rich adhesin for platelets-like [Homarus americanus]|uniref:serine-rich adhesin for platelets-like n=1 Tax=Homarus americanus TaxID=6706 RepID=UPI001C47DF77|nr:serine-rich adhesin for platelets-like [Homarus americanus]
MAPICSRTSLSNNSSTSSNMTSCHCNSSTNSLWNTYLPISRRGLFFQDSHFGHAHALFEDALRQVLGSWGETEFLTDKLDDTSFRLSNNLSRYRQLRAQNLKEENLAITASSDNTCHKIVVDVHDFMDGEVKVKIVGEKEVLVEGHVEKTKNGSSASSHSFRRQFILPHMTNMEAVTAVLSSDGILTITAPKIVNDIKKECTTIPIQVEGKVNDQVVDSSTTSSSQAASNTSTSSTDGQFVVNQNEECDCKGCCQKYEEEKSITRLKEAQKVPIKINSTLVKSECNSHSSEVQSSSEHSSNLGEISKQESQCKTNNEMKNNSDTEVHTEKSSSTATEIRNVPLSKSSFLPITRRGQFFNDSFFENSRNDFQNAVNEILRKWGETDVLTDRWDDTNFLISNNLSRYRLLRAKNLKEENQAFTVTTDSTCHKIVMDVNEFMDGEVKVKVVGETEVVVEGRMKTNNGEFSLSCQSFRRRFSVPDLTDTKAITSVMSSDGILTITIPIAVSQIKDTTTTIPITIQGDLNTPTDAKITKTTVSEGASGNSASSSISQKFDTKEDKCEAQECQKKKCHQITNDSTGTARAQNDGNVKLSSVSAQSNCTSHSQHSDEKQSTSQSSAMHIPMVTALPITTRGLFFNDSFFQDAWKDFQEAVKEVVSKWGKGCSANDDMTSYRSLRSRDMRDENQAVKSSQDEFNYKFLVDVQDFTTGGDISVKAVNDRELMVEGRVEKEEAGSKYTKKFLRRFVVPRDIHLESVSSVMSADGVLTITAPKKPKSLHIKEVIVPMSVEEGNQETESLNQSSSDSLKTRVETQTREPTPAVSIKAHDSSDSSTVNFFSGSSADTKASLHEESSTQHNSSLASATVGRGREHVIPVHVVEENESQTETSDKNSMKTKEEKSFSIQEKQKVSAVNKILTEENVNEKNVSKADVKPEVAPDLQGTETDHQVSRLETRSNANKNMNINIDKNMSNVNQYNRRQGLKSSSLFENRALPISLKGAFFNDSFFKDARENYVAAVKDVLKRTKRGSFQCDDITTYRNLRQLDLREENQAVRVEEDQQSLKIVVDVYDFIGGDVKVEVVGGKEVVVEGRANKEEGTSVAAQTFLLRFSLPPSVDLEAITSVMSSDGVLTIISPKLQHSSETGARSKQMFMESKSRKDAHSDGGQAWEEKNVRKSAQESEGCSSRTISSTHRSHQQYSSNKPFFVNSFSRINQVKGNMAPICSRTSLSNNSSTSSNMTSCHCNSSTNSLWNTYLPISRRGLFFQDSHFGHAHALFEDALRQVLGSWGETEFLTDKLDDTSFRLSNNLSRYRQLRAQNLKEENLAITASSDNTCHKIVVDVHDFMDGEVKVKIVGEKEVLVEGHVEKTKNGSSASSHSFRRQFILPHMTNMEAVTAVLSSDGILTITAPKIENDTQKECATIPIQVEGKVNGQVVDSSTTSSSQAASNTSTSSTDGQFVVNQNEECDCKGCCQKYEEEKSITRLKEAQKVPIKINSTLVKSECNSHSSDVQSSSEHSSNLGEISKQESQCKTNNEMKNTSDTEVHTEKSSSTATEIRNVPLSKSSFLPITRRGQFFNDSFFENSRNDFQNAVNEILRKWGETDVLTDRWDDTNFLISNNLSRYRLLRAKNLKEENQAFTVSTDSTCHKIVMDVHEFMDGEVKVKVVGETEVVVEGRMKTNNGEFSLSCQSFRRRFSVPDLTDTKAITSVMSSDGILTITIPIAVSQIKDTTTTIPITIQGDLNTPTDAKITKTTVSEGASGNSASSSISQKFDTKEDKCEAQECQKKKCHQITNDSTGTARAQNDGNVKLPSVSAQSNCTSHSQHSDEKQSTSQSSAMHIPMATALPITTRGLFFNDSFFQDAWKDFQEAVKEVVSKWGKGCSANDDMTSYRSLRSRDMRDENQAVKSSQDEFNYKFLVDVQDFTTGGDISVKAVNDRELMVEGRVEKEEAGSKYTKKFLRRFVVPRDIHLESVSSVMSADGVLTITAPKKPKSLHIKEVIVPISVEEGNQETESYNQSSSDTLKTRVETQTREPTPAVSIKAHDSSDSSTVNLSSGSSADTEASLHEEFSTQHNSSLASATVGPRREHVIPVHVVEEDESQTETSDKKEGKSFYIQEKQNVSAVNKILTEQDVTEKNVSKADVKPEVAPDLQGTETDHQVSRLETRSNANKNMNINIDKNMSNVNQYNRRQGLKSSSLFENRALPISLKGAFFNDSFFKDARENYVAAVKDVLKRTKRGSFQCDDITTYRNLRQLDLREENQAVRVEEDQQSLKIVVDVYDFIGGDVKVEVVGGKEVVVEGRANKEEGTSVATQTFLLRFSLPPSVDLEAITSVMSSDGVLTIISPKLQHSSETGARSKQMFMESKSRKDAHSDGGQAWEEKNVRKSAQESEGCSSRTISSTHRSHQQYSSNKQF